MNIIEESKDFIVRHRKKRLSKIDATSAAGWMYIVLVLMSFVCLSFVSNYEPDEFFMSLSVAFLQLAVGIFIVNYSLSRIEKRDNWRIASFLFEREFKSHFSDYRKQLAEFSHQVEKTKQTINKISANSKITRDDHECIFREAESASFKMYELSSSLSLCMKSLEKISDTGIFIKDLALIKAYYKATTLSKETNRVFNEFRVAYNIYKSNKSEYDIYLNIQGINQKQLNLELPRFFLDISLSKALDFENFISVLLCNLYKYRVDTNDKA